MAAEYFPSRKIRKRRSKKLFWRSLRIIKTSNLIALIMVVVIGITAIGGNYFKEVPKSTVVVFSQNWLSWQDILFAGLPLLAYFNEKAPAAKTLPQLSARRAMNRFVYFLTNVDTENEHTLLAIPFLPNEKDVLAAAAQAPQTPGAAKARVPGDTPPQPVNLSDKALVGIYHTHTAESFIPTSGVSHKPGGQLGDIVTVGEALVKELEKRGILCLQSKTIHDYPSFMKAYGASEVSVRKMLSENSGLKVVIDIHRDAGKRENSVIKLNNGDAARLAMVLAQGQDDLPQPLWQQNLALAKLIDAKLNSYYPGLSRGIQFSEWRYNQHLHPHALLLEVGCQENSLEEALRSMEMLAHVLSDLFKEGKI
ncbi:MAG: stage II sporulation protein P [Sporomusaceae bacterium]|nr:stage II sporulation protein P [Sporomusaceae bacterium]